ncbi:hypothetical protein V2G26_000718 [Clonostachys chloroleuca]
MDQSPGTWSIQAPAPEKSSELYIRDHPHRSIAIVSSSHTLILRYSSSSSDFAPNGSHASLHSNRGRNGAGDSTSAKCMVEFTPVTQKLLKDYRPLSHRPVYGTLGLIAVNGEVFLSIITQAARVASVRPGETVEQIGGVAFYCLSSADYDDVVPLDAVEPEMSDAVSTYAQNSPYGQNLSRRDVLPEHPCHELRKLLSNGSFYYSTDFDVTNRMQDRPMNSDSFEIDNFDDAFLWNSYMIKPLVKFRSRLMSQEREALDASRILTSAFRGFCKTMTIPQNSSPLRAKTGMPSYLTLTSRLSCRRAGTRFNSRGIDDDGHVANFVETETTFWSPAGVAFSYAQIRGSVPVFWEQAADLIPGRQKITVTRSPEGAQPAFNKHFEELEHTYGAVHVINLLSETKPGEVELSNLYRNGLRHCPLTRPSPDGSVDHALLRDTQYDFHAETKGPAGYEAAKDIRRYIEHSTDGFAYFLAEQANDSSNDLDGLHKSRMVVILQQEGVFRTNCLDCLDRTNLIQSIISQMAVEAFLGHRGEYAAADFWMRHSSLWADNGDSLSKIYAGTGALKSSFTRHGKMSLAGAVADVRKSVQRIYHNNFLDPSRQITIDMLLGRLVGQAPVYLFDPVSDYVSAELGKRSEEYTSFRSISMWVGTFNLNGRTEGADEDLSPWLFPPAMGSTQPDVYAVGFQEIVELSPQQIMNSDPTRKQLWEQVVRNTLNRRQAALGGEKYVLLRSEQLVGAALCVFVKTSSLGRIKNVEGSVKKTGMSGMAGNKGAVAVRFDYANTQICFVTAHLAAGFANYDERNRDYATIHHGLRFQRNRSIDDHDAVIWLGDFNYRIGLTSETARSLVQRGDLETLYENDQLNLQMVAGLAFPFYSEARITFLPTYKFDIGTDTYDTSEKARIPAWTDRILRKGPNLRQNLYNCAPLKFSDHRPVYATFDCRVSIIDEPKREAISQQLYSKRIADVGDAVHIAEGDETEDEDLIGYDAVEPGLPPASSDRHKWWLDKQQPARAQVTAPEGRDGQPMVLNPHRPSNPFGHNEEQDWISISRSSSRASLTSLSSSPFEKVMVPSMINSSASSIAPRKAPPVGSYENGSLAAKVGRMNLASDQDVRAGGVPPQLPPRRQTGDMTPDSPSVLNAAGGPRSGSGMPAGLQAPLRPTSAASSFSSTQGNYASPQPAGGKQPPPVAKKPAYLTSPVLSDPSSNGAAAPLQKSRTMPVAASSRKQGPVLPPARASGSMAGPSQRNPGQHQQQGPMDLLDDPSQDLLGGWEALQPTSGTGR